MRLFEFFQNPQEGNDMLLHECNLTCFPSLSSGKNRVKIWVYRKLLHVCILTCFPSFSSPTRVEQFSCWFELKPIVIILKLIFVLRIHYNKSLRWLPKKNEEIIMTPINNGTLFINKDGRINKQTEEVYFSYLVLLKNHFWNKLLQNLK